MYNFRQLPSHFAKCGGNYSSIVATESLIAFVIGHSLLSCGCLHGDQRRMGGGYNLSQCKGTLKGTMGRCEFLHMSHVPDTDPCQQNTLTPYCENLPSPVTMGIPLMSAVAIIILLAGSLWKSGRFAARSRISSLGGIAESPWHQRSNLRRPSQAR